MCWSWTRPVFPRDKVCAGWITPQVVRDLELDRSDYASGRVLQPVTGFRTGPMRGRLLETRYDTVVSYAIRRREFDHYLLQRAGAGLRLGEALHSLERVDGLWTVNGDIRAPMLVGAGGHACPVARRVLARPEPIGPLVLAQEAEVPLARAQDCHVHGDTPELYFCRDLLGYGWCVRKGGWLNIGLGREDPGGLPDQVKRFCQWLVETGRIPPVPAHRFKGHAYLLYGTVARPLITDGALLIGDAAGLAYPRSGEGIRPAVESGLLAADAIADARPDFRASRLQPYQSGLEQRLGRPGRIPLPAIAGLKQALGGLVLRNRVLTRRLLLDDGFLQRSIPALSDTTP